MTRSRAAPLRIVLAATIATVPHQAGWTWVVLQYLLGLRRLGHRVHLLDPLGDDALRPAGAALCASRNATYFRQVLAAHGLGADATLLGPGPHPETIGASSEALARLVRDADVLINVSGVLRDPALLALARRRVYLDVDPGFTQLWEAVDGVDMGLSAHTHVVTLGWGFGRDGSPVPSLGRRWISTWQPVVLEHWTAGTDIVTDGFTTVANWRSYGSVRHGGRFFGQKAHALRALIHLPRHTPEALVLALAIDPGDAADRWALLDHGWQLVEPCRAASTPARYRAFVQGSKAELAVAKSGYVEARCGWFSDRSVCYLAAGRPVLAQDTGFGDRLPSGRGLLSFATVDEAADGIERINADYPRHARAARDLAEAYFDSDRVLGRLLDEVGG